MSELNPYAPPQADLTPEFGPTSQVLATPWVRLGAQIVDGLIAAVVILPLQFLTGYYGRVAEAAQAGSTMILEPFLWVPVNVLIMVAINWTFLLNGQTIGKKLLKVRIVRKDGSPIDRTRIITHRMLPVWIASVIPFIGSLAVLVDGLCIFRAGRNTLHDDIADTKVIQAPAA